MRQGIGRIFGSVVMVGAVVAGLWVLRTARPAVAPVASSNQTVPVTGKLVGEDQSTCTAAQTYRIGAIDSRFGISNDDVLSDVRTAVNPWEDAAGRTLFRYDENSHVTDVITLNFVYDDRQAATDQLKTLLGGITSDQGRYDAAKKKHDAILASLAAKKAAYDKASGAYDDEKKKDDALAKKYDGKLAEYGQAVSEWNANPGNAATSNSLEKQHQDLHDLEDQIKKKQGDLKDHFKALEAQRLVINDLVGQGNALVGIVNTLAEKSNKQVEAYNTTGQAQGEFDAGEYRVDGEARSITIYEYFDQKNLELVLAHEFGHALGFGHVDDPKAIMYYQAGDQAPVLSDADRALVEGLCKQ